jgi:PBP1b-binding outer membrane lipoprotein LpoB
VAKSARAAWRKSRSTNKRFCQQHEKIWTGAGADYILQGSINSIVDAHKRKKEVFYQVNLELTNIETNEVVWIGDKKIAKLVKN